MLVPARVAAQQFQRAVHVGLPLAHHAHERAVADHLDAGGLPVLVELREARAGRRRAENPAVEQPVRPEVGEVPGPPEDLVGQVQSCLTATDRCCCDGIGRSDRGDIRGGVERRDPEDVVRPWLGRSGQGTDNGAHVAQRRPGLQDRQAPGSQTLVGTVGRVGGDHADPAQRKGERVCSNLCERRQDALAELDLADVDLDNTAGDGDPRAKPGVVLDVGWNGAHGVGSRAASTASTIRRCAPQRHRLRSSASATRSASAAGSASSSAAARTTIPEMQKPHCAA